MLVAALAQHRVNEISTVIDGSVEVARPLEETLADTVAAMVEHGQLSAKYAGTLVE